MDNNINSDLLLDEKDPAAELFEEKEEKELEYRKPRSAKRNKLILIILLCVLGVAIIAGAIFGCIAFLGEEEYDNTADFYFSSDLLSQEGGEYTVYGDIEFNLANYADALRTSAENIESYTVSVKADGKDITSKCEVEKELSALTKGSRISGKVSISVPDKYCGIPLDVEVVSYPVDVTLKASFTVLPDWGFKFSDEEGSVSASLSLYANEELTLLVKWDPDKLVADSTNAYVKASDEDYECEVTLEAGSGAEIYFFKPDMNAVFKESDKSFPIEITKVKTKKKDESSKKDEEKETDDSAESETADSAEDTQQTEVTGNE
ncbi:MAG: hypothetical protein IJD17_00555 [Clostridia bacterium]|nr:hypothetical protein [Clostridia bacterium]